MGCASQAPAVAGSLSGLLVYGTVTGAAALGALGFRRERGVHGDSDLDALAAIVDASTGEGEPPGEVPAGR